MGLKINFYCDEKYRNTVPEPVASAKCYPKWFSELPLNNRKFKYQTNPENQYELINDFNKVNIKKCLGIQEFLSTGYIIPSWCDFIFREEENGGLYINWMEDYFGETSYESHADEQFSNMPNKPIYGHFGKIYTPWIIKTDPGVSCLITHPWWHRNKSFTSSTGIVHSDVSPFKIPWFFEWNYKIETKMNVENINTEKQVVPKGEPLMLIIPFYRKTFSSKINYISEEKINNLNSSQLHLTHDSTLSQCPYKNFRKTLGKLFQ
jgi:hypothetical protein